MKNTLTLLILLFPQMIWAQTSRLSDPNPKAGESIDIFYQPNEKSRFKLEDQVFARVMLSYPDYRSEDFILPMERKNGEFHTRLEIKKGVAIYEIGFQTDKQSDFQALQKVRPQDEKGNYLKNAFWPAAQQSGEGYKKELEYYPQNYAVYKGKWQLAGYSNKGSLKEIILQDIALLTQKAKKNAAFYYALTSGYAQLGDFAKSREQLQLLLEKSPESALSQEAYSWIRYQFFAHQNPDSLTIEVVRNFVRKNPETILARENLDLLYENEKPKYPGAIAAITNHWLPLRPDLAHLSYHQARVEKDPAKKIYLLNQAAQAYLDKENGLKNFYKWDSSIPYYMKQIIKALIQEGKEANALAYSYLYEKYSKQIDGKFLQQKAQILQALHSEKEALHAYIAATERGNKASLDLARSVFDQVYGTSRDFDQYYQQIARELFYKEEVSPAPAFRVKDLAGKEWDLSALKGKVVVLNFWFIGCLPCREEIPGLNEMVAKYSPEEVVFLAFALDDAPHLEKFLAKNNFDYQIIPESDGPNQSFRVGSYPTHIIIDKDGKIRSTLVGGSADRHRQIQPLIDRLLKF